MFTLERVMQSFRARSQILAETLEENDNVMQKRHFGSTFDISTDVLTEYDENNYDHNENEYLEEASTFNRKGTFKINKAEVKPNRKGEMDRNIPNNKENVSQETQKKLRDLSINIK